MPELLSDPFTLIVFGFIAVAGVVFGAIRGEPPWMVAANIIGTNAFLFGLRWAGAIGEEAFTAAAIASGGMAVLSEVAFRQRRKRSAEASLPG